MKTDQSNLQAEAIADLARRKKISRRSLRSLTPDEKIERLVALQEQYYQMLKVREENGGRSVPEKWRKWYIARHKSAKSV